MGEDRFKMCLFEPVQEERRQQGWTSDIPDHNWIVGPPSSSNDIERLCKIICDADVAVMGACPQKVQEARAATGKLTFVMTERLLKRGFFQIRMLNPRFAKGIRGLRLIANRPNVHYLAIGDYAVSDVKLIGAFGNRIWKWAYFISETQELRHEYSLPPVRILWAGRFLRWKRVDVILRAMSFLGSEAENCTLELIGDGKTRRSIERLAKRLGMDSRVCFRESITHKSVRERMAQADIYVFPSNHQEGWGAVVGEAMCEGCVVVASKAAGAAKILIEHGRTGFLFNDGDVRELSRILKHLIENRELRRQIGQAAAMQMQQLWHPRVGAERLVDLCQGLLGLSPMPDYHEGPVIRIGES